MPKTEIADTRNPRTLLFKPRQVLLSEKNMKSNRTLKPEQKTSLLHSIAAYLQSNGFSKTLKKFRSEAHLEKDGHSESIISLEDMFCNYLETCDYSSKSIGGLKMRDAQMDGNSVRDKEADFETGAEIVCKKKKKRCDEDSHAIVGQSEDNKVLELNLKSKDKKKKKKNSDSQGQLEQVSAEYAQMDGNSVRDKEADFETGAEIVCKKKKKRCDEDSHAIVGQSEDNKVLELNLKSKDKKKKKKNSDSQGQLEQVSAEPMKEPVDSVVCDQQLQEPDKKHKEKKEKKRKLDSKSVIENFEHHGNTTELDVGKSSRTESKKDDSKTLDKDATDKESKQSKKRKRLAAEENDSQLDKIEVEESKRRKTEGSEELKGSEQVTELNGTVGNLNIKKEGEKSALHKHMKKQANDSAEPKTVKAFQRVKVDEVVFTDERLKDNSYWAKAGAESGYGAKAQEVLGQVRGRDFRHEKTKKKRGSYRGGLIDVQSHSIKFNYSDEE